jgi:hypothetical protein
MKAAATTDKELWKDFQWNDMEETREEFISRIETAGLL